MIANFLKLLTFGWATFCKMPFALVIVMKSNPGISFTEVGKVLGERWNKMTGTPKISKLAFQYVCIVD